ncbi:hypothetical protein O0L34_g18654 [Tuta absoluta]|nr:hypothetical protein O0L34_g18654 [Tuta absoluta]
MEHVFDDRLLKIMGKFDQEQVIRNLNAEKALKDLTEKVVILGERLTLLEHQRVNENKSFIDLNDKIASMGERLTSLENTCVNSNKKPEPKQRKKQKKTTKSTESTETTKNLSSSPPNVDSLLENANQNKDEILVLPPCLDTTSQIQSIIEEHQNSAIVNSTIMNQDDAWIEVGKKPSRSTLTNVTRGAAPPRTTRLEAAERVKYLHLYYVKSGTTKEQVLDYLDSICGAGMSTVEVLKSRGNYASFKLGVPSKVSTTVMSPQYWVEDICIKPWQNFRANKSSKVETS